MNKFRIYQVSFIFRSSGLPKNKIKSSFSNMFFFKKKQSPSPTETLLVVRCSPCQGTTVKRISSTTVPNFSLQEALKVGPIDRLMT